MSNTVVDRRHLVERNRDGVDAETLFKSGRGLALGDFTILPGHESQEAYSLKACAVRNRLITRPFAAITDRGEIAAKIAQYGGLCVLTRDVPVNEQANMVTVLKRHGRGIIEKPLVLSPEDTIAGKQVIEERYGVSSVPVTEDGQVHGKLAGIVTNRDTRSEQDPAKELREVMTTEGLVTAPPDISLENAIELLQMSKKDQLLIVDRDGYLRGLLTKSNIGYALRFPDASYDARGRLLVAAAIAPGDTERIAALARAEVDIIVIEPERGNAGTQKETVLAIKEQCSGIAVVPSRVVTAAQAARLIGAGADGLIVGTPDTLRGIGRSAASALYHVAQYTRYYATKEKTQKVPVIADLTSVDLQPDESQAVKALAIGASAALIEMSRPSSAVKELLDNAQLGYNPAREYETGRTYPPAGPRQETAQTSAVLARRLRRQKGTWQSEEVMLQRLSRELTLALEEFGCASIDKLHEALYSGALRFEHSPSGEHGLWAQ
ncbi:MAG: IMP dehydrogenase [bacterium]|nr:IMP dehydrogenase [bacterium]MDZ4296241.1 IMP dehydrogenase [Patescibacteria group bacterium]